MTELPKRIVIQGGGYIALEFACIFAGFGSDVTRDLSRRQHPARFRRGCARARPRRDGEARHHHPDRLHGRQGRSARRGIHLAFVEWVERRFRPGDVRDRPASDTSPISAWRRPASTINPKNGGIAVDDFSQNQRAAHLCDRRRHASFQPDAGCDPRGPCVCGYACSASKPDAAWIMRTFRRRCSRSRRSARWA